MRYLKPIALTCMLLAASAAQALSAERIALVIGNSSYENIAALKNPSNDAQLMASTLSDVGFDVITALDVDRREMARAVRSFGSRLREAGDDTVGLFYYAGHGVQHAGDNYLIPIGAQIEFSSDLSVEALRVTDILRQMQEAQNVINLVILDACRNNPFPQGTRSVERGLARPSTINGSLMAFAAAPGEAALDGDGANSPYTLALAEAMRTPGLPVEQVFKLARTGVITATEGRQTPWEESSLVTDFFFLDGEPEDNSESLELTFWNSAIALDTITGYEEYLSAYPNGAFASLAAVRLQELRDEVSSDAQDGARPADPPSRDDPYSAALAAHNRGEMETAAQLYRDAAESGNTSAMIQLAGLYLEGDGVERSAETAITWYEAAADVGDAEATFLIGRIYERGTGVVRNFQLAIEWYERAAGLGSANAMNNLGVMHSLGEGVDKDDAEALNWFIRGAAAGNVNSMFNLAAMYDEGRGTTRSPGDAARYMLDALQSGNQLVVQEMTGNAHAWSREFRMELQRLLQSEGHYQGAIDGSFGPGTQAAIVAASDGGT